jgi:4-hydroxymandelate oxidase
MAPVNLFDIEALARPNLSHAAADYFAGGADDEVSLRANRAVYERLYLRPRYLVDVSRIDLSVTAMETPIPFPVIIAPTGFQQLAHPEGERAMARAAAAVGTIMTLSTFSTVAMEDVQTAASGPKWFQLYVHKDRGLTRNLVERAEAAGFRALMLTVDVPMIGRRERDIRNGFALPTEMRVANFDFAESETLHTVGPDSGLANFVRGLREPAFSWPDVDWLASLTRLPVMLKGILRGDDARRALDHGVTGIIVSNHGGRQLDGAIPGLLALPEVAEAVAGQAEVYVDGGVRRGTDVVKSLALGARAVLIGRPVVWGLAWNGAEGVITVLQMLRDEFEVAMGLVGASAVKEITRDLVTEAVSGAW